MAGSSASRSRRSHNAIGTRTQASSTAEYSFPCVKIIWDLAVIPSCELLLCQIVQGLAARCIALCLVSDHVPDVNATVCSRHVEGDFSFLQQLNEKLPRYAQDFAGFDSREFMPVLEDGYRLTGTQISQQPQ